MAYDPYTRGPVGNQRPKPFPDPYARGPVGNPNPQPSPDPYARTGAVPGPAARPNPFASIGAQAGRFLSGPAKPPVAPTPEKPPVPATGTESGPGILETWFNQRATGTDPAFEYMSGRGMDAIDNRMSAGGAFNSGARGQQISDFMANLQSQRMGALDSLAGGASGEHQRRLESMFNQGIGLAGGQAGTSGAYDLGAAGAMSDANKAILSMFLNKAGVDSQANQQLINNVLGGLSIYKGGA